MACSIYGKKHSHTMQLEIGNISTECCHQGESIKKCEQTLLFIAMHCWGYMSLEVKGQWGLLYFLITVIQQSGTSSSSSWLKCSSKGIIYIWRASITSSSCPHSWSIIDVFTGSSGESLLPTSPSFSFFSHRNHVVDWSDKEARKEDKSSPTFDLQWHAL